MALHLWVGRERLLTDFEQRVIKDLNLTGLCRVRDLWQNRIIGNAAGTFSRPIAPHGAGLYRLTPGTN